MQTSVTFLQEQDESVEILIACLVFVFKRYAIGRIAANPSSYSFLSLLQTSYSQERN